MKEQENCFSCKVISVCTLVGIGSYLIHKGRGQTPTSKYTMFVTGTVIASLGIGEIFEKSPFR